MHESFWYVVVLGPTVLLMVSGLVLVWRQRSIATVLVALGFGAMLVSTLAATILSADLSVQYSAGRDLAIVSARWRGWTWLTHYLGFLGMWIGGGGLLWHSYSSSAAMPNNRIERPRER